MDSEEQAVPVLLNVLSDILLIKVNLSNNFFQCICTLLKLFDLSFCHSHWNFALYTIWSVPELMYSGIHHRFRTLHAS